MAAAIMTFTSTHFGVVQSICYCPNDTMTRIVLPLDAFIRIANSIEYWIVAS